MGDGGFGHEGRTFGDFLDALDEGPEFGEFAGADGVADFGGALDDVGGDAAGVEVGVVDAGVGRHVFAHVVDADVHEFDGVERRAAEMGGGGGVAGAADEGEVDAGVGQAHRVVDAGEGGGVPGDGDVDVLEGAFADHEGFGRTTFLGGAAVVADAAFEVVFGEPVLDGGGGEEGGGAEEVVAAAVAEAVAGEGAFFGDVGFLAEAGQGVVFAEDGDDGAVFAGFAHDGGGDAGDVLGDAEALGLEHGGVFGGGFVLVVGDFGFFPDAVGEV